LIRFADPRARFEANRDEYQAALNRVAITGNYLMGPELEALETEFANYVGVPKAVGVANATDAIEIVLRCLGVKEGDEVITVSFTAGATISGILNAGATPVLIDVERRTRNMNPELLAGALTSRTRAVMPVHLYGNPAAIEDIATFCRDEGLLLLEDCSQAHGAKVGTKRVGSFGDAGIFSCYPTKNLGAFGDAALISVNNGELAAKIASARQYGWRYRRNEAVEWGRNSRLDEIQAAVLRVGLQHLDEENALRQSLARYYCQLFELGSDYFQQQSVYHLFVVEVDPNSRAVVMQRLLESGIETAIHYPYAADDQSFFKTQVRLGSDLSHTKVLVRSVLSLPSSPYLSLGQISFDAAEVIKSHLSRR
jgi:dTDP-4-amino-4,6-dideoxygalactose transaminase